MVETMTRSAGDKGLVVMKKDIRETRSVRLGSMINEEKKVETKEKRKGQEETQEKRLERQDLVH
ncbi:hypothetical protein F2Q69_00020605 [Brassica cretica]|uniref:Uncharacterized protein n=1 Tax=Brassica cretica TaxID=69181 RepID=A0A8S9QFB2_BRACR|nr:hypothetical protein F2Q69_00020605 [Brassica cretica]